MYTMQKELSPEFLAAEADCELIHGTGLFLIDTSVLFGLFLRKFKNSKI